MPSRATVSEIIGPAGKDMQMLPPTVAVFQTLNDARNAWQHWRISGAAVHSGGASRASNCAIVQVGDIWSPCSSTTSGAQSKPCRSSSRRRCGCGSEKSQVPPASQLSPSCQSKSSSPFPVTRRIPVMVFRSTWQVLLTMLEVQSCPHDLHSPQTRTRGPHRELSGSTSNRDGYHYHLVVITQINACAI